MPIYEYRCNDCGFQKEYLQKFSDPAHTHCPSCGQESFAKLLSAAGFLLKGSGWYATDFRGGGAQAGAKSDENSGGQSGGDADSTSSAHTCGAGACSACS